LSASLGDLVDSGPVLSYTGTTRVVRVALDVALQGLVHAGITATVTLPNGSNVVGAVRSVGAVATPGASPTDPATVDVTIAVAHQSRLGRLDRAPVAVALVSARAANVLTVPVAALVALSSGGYGVQAVTGATSHYIAVRLGMFADGRVQISGPGIAAGTLVGVAA